MVTTESGGVAQSKPKVGDEGNLGPIKGVWTEINGVGFYAFKLPLGNPPPEAYSELIETLRKVPRFTPRTFGEKYVEAIDSLRHRLFGE